ncbi:MAG: hypothetical protein AB4050_16215 [Synechococcus sp.]
MPVKWKRNKSLRPKVIIKKISEIISISHDGRLSIYSLEYFNAVSALQNMLDFPTDMDVYNKENLVTDAISLAYRKSDSTVEESDILEAINQCFRIECQRREKEFSILTSISLQPPFPVSRISIDGCQIKILKSYPRQYLGRKDIIAKHKHIDDLSNDYGKVVVVVRSNHFKLAAEKAIKALEMLRATLCLINSELGGIDLLDLLNPKSLPEPINQICLGEIHTIHDHSGMALTQGALLNPKYQRKQPITSQSLKNGFKKIGRKVFKGIDSYPPADRNKLQDVLIRYVQSLDEADHNTAFLKLWGALESLATSSGSNYDPLVRRCSFLFDDREYHSQILEQLKAVRNEAIHAGIVSPTPKHCCLQLQSYFYNLFFYHILNPHIFSCVEEANSFLDLPKDIDILRNKRRLIDRAIKFMDNS